VMFAHLEKFFLGHGRSRISDKKRQSPAHAGLAAA
jgi:hypothetical protein